MGLCCAGQSLAWNTIAAWAVQSRFHCFLKVLAVSCLCNLSGQLSMRMFVSELQERWEIPGAEFLPGTSENGAKEGAVKRYLAFSVGPRSPSLPYIN